MRSRPGKMYECIRDRIADERVHALIDGKMTPRRLRRFARWDPRLHRLLVGTKSGHRTPAARRWRTVLRFKRLIACASYG